MNKHAHFASIGFTLVFGFSYMFSKVALAYVPPMGLIAYRYLLAFLFLEILRRLHVIHVNVHRHQLKAIAMVVLFQPVLYSILSIYGINLIASSEAIMMIALIPVFAGIISAFVLKEVPNVKQALFILLSLSGVVYIQMSLQQVDTPSSPWGFVLVLGSVLCGAIYNVSSRHASRSLHPVDVTYFMMLVGAITFNALYIGMLAVEGDLAGYVTRLGKIELLLPVLYLGILSSVLAFFLLNYALSKLPAHVTGIYANLVTVIGVFAGYFILNEALYGFHFIGSAMIVMGVYGTIVSQKKHVSSPIAGQATFKDS
ncbi:MAG: EamA/RhaT family transporter [Acholeplasmataceae bacterium]|nr:MAG: EamA/RhaT family transporter [Acholeplasmataceae bacterium]